MNEENVFIPSNNSINGFSIKSGGEGVGLKKLDDSIGEGNSEDYSDDAVNVQRVNEEGDTSRVKSGINGFDELIQGGFIRESIVLIVGASGTGKTILSMQFLYNGAALYDEPGVFISFGENKTQLYRQANQFGWDFDELEKANKFRLLNFKPHQVTKILEEGGGQIRDALSEIKAKRIVIDSITAYGLLFRDEYKRREKILAFFNLLRRWGVTSLVVCEDDPEVVEKEEGGIGFLSDAVVSLYYDQYKEKGIRVHSLEVLKMRGTKHTNKVCAINFEKDGITVYPDVEIF
ncbi:MAG: RAD55 family ATPase [Candidatus Iainarchaeum sp.]|jgi:KaiC/GvpD/RAD55 family RecA-like ATPase|nr:MAG: circadian clock protein KaiC [archaeon ADurb.Bin336]